jgi:hypothetical protein
MSDYYERRVMYCEKCGKKCKEKHYYGYDRETGKRLEFDTSYHCPVEKCGHRGHSHDYKPYSIFFIRWFTGEPDEKCTKCGHGKWHCYGLDGLY